MTRIQKLEREIELTKELIELRKQLAAPIIVLPNPFQCVPQNPFLSPPMVSYPYVGDSPPTAPSITWGVNGGQATC